MSDFRELSCGSLHGRKWSLLDWVFVVCLSEHSFTVFTPFKKIRIPVSSIHQVKSAYHPLFTKGLIVGYNDAAKGPRHIFFMSVRWREWFGAFERLGVHVNDRYQFRTASTDNRALAGQMNRATLIVGAAAVAGWLLVTFGLLVYRFFTQG